MTIDEYKQAVVALVKQMEGEHGCKVESLKMETETEEYKYSSSIITRNVTIVIQ